MDKENSNEYSKYIFLLFLVLILTAAFLIVRPFISMLLTSLVIVYIFYPIFNRINSKIKNKDISAFITSILAILIIVIPLIFAANSIIVESIHFFRGFDSLEFNKVSNVISTYLNLDNEEVKVYIKDLVNKGVSFIIEIISDILIGIPEKVVGLFILLFSLFYFFRDGKELVINTKRLVPLGDKEKDKLFDRIKSITNSMIYGILVTAIIEAVLAIIAFYIFDVGSPVLWGLVVFILAVLPAVSASLVWIPAVIIKLITGDMVNGIGLFLYGVIIIGSVEFLLKPRIIGNKARIHPILVLVGAFGGLKVVGLIGIIIGPIVLGIMVTVLDFYRLNK